MKIWRIDNEEDDVSEVITTKLQTDEGNLPNPQDIQKLTCDFAAMPELSFADLYTYLVGTEEYTAENLKSFKSLHGYKLFSDGHVEDCVMHCVKDKGYT